jgi:hypothetical protein
LSLFDNFGAAEVNTCRFSTATTPRAAAHPPPCLKLGRSTDATKRAYTDGLLVVIDDIAARLAPDDPQLARVKTLSVFALMVGTLQLHGVERLQAFQRLRWGRQLPIPPRASADSRTRSAFR